MVFQSYALCSAHAVRDNLSFGLKVASRPRAEIDAPVRTAAEMLRITELLDRRPAELFRRPAPARRDRTRAGARGAGLPVRRAAVESPTPSCAPSCASRSSACNRRLGATISS